MYSKTKLCKTLYSTLPIELNWKNLFKPFMSSLKTVYYLLYYYIISQVGINP